jgi:uncharacterized membrane protein YhaH (DUF805 family)
MLGVFELIFALVLAVLLVAALLGAARTLSKAGYPGWWALLLLVPVVNLVALSIFGGADWPVLRRLRALEGATGRTAPGAFRRG